ncbi:MAG: hypothetical protein R3F17_12375 [Planctomycetota bacterium]
MAGPEDKARYLELVHLVEGVYEETIAGEVRGRSPPTGTRWPACARAASGQRARAHPRPPGGAGRLTHEPDEGLMQSVEEESASAKRAARRLPARADELHRHVAGRGRTFGIENKRLAEALERKLFEDQKDQIHLTSLVGG